MWRWIRSLLLGVTYALLVGGFALLLMAAKGAQQNNDLVIGAQLYDKWYAVLGVEPPPGNMPIWSRQSTNTRSGADTWRCVECHGWDYKGNQGAYKSGSHFTGFPSLMIIVPNLSEEDIVNHLKGKKDPQHNFSAYLDETSMRRLALFLKQGLIDDAQYIDSLSLKVIDGNPERGKLLYSETCSRCHGQDGGTIIFRTEGIEETLGDVARRDPWRFLHRTRFGVAGTEMPIGYNLGWTAADGRDVLAYAQTLPAARVKTTPAPGAAVVTPAKPIGGPATTWWQGVLTGLAAFLGTLGGSLVLFSVFLILAILVISILRRRK